MTQEEISEYNKMCAEFLGIVKGYFKSEIDCPILEYQWMVVSANCTYEMQKEDFPLLNVYDYLKFHSDWNWIMEVVNKIEETNIVDIFFMECRINERQGTIGPNNDVIVWCQGETKKAAVVQAINNFLIWYKTDNDDRQ